jgi:hypothetical protein
MVGRLLNRVQGWLQAQVVTVPAEIELCEFDCRRVDCSPEVLLNCQRRLNFVAEKAAAEAQLCEQLCDACRPSAESERAVQV